MLEYDCQQELQYNLVAKEKLEILLDKIEDELDDTLNFNYGYASVMSDKIVGHILILREPG